MSYGLAHPHEEVRACYERGNRTMRSLIAHYSTSKVEVATREERYPPVIDSIGGAPIGVYFRAQRRAGYIPTGDPRTGYNGKGDIIVLLRRNRHRSKRFPGGKDGVDERKVIAHIDGLIASEAAGEKAKKAARRKEKMAWEEITAALKAAGIKVGPYHALDVEHGIPVVRFSGMTREQMAAVLRAAVKSGYRLTPR
jgi:hypothetical protein